MVVIASAWLSEEGADKVEGEGSCGGEGAVSVVLVLRLYSFTRA
jgi:hypothetical protein